MKIILRYAVQCGLVDGYPTSDFLMAVDKRYCLLESDVL
jgi:hypothetical protein